MSPPTSRFVIVDDFEIRGGGIVREALPDRQAGVRDRVLLRNYKWEPSIIQPEHRAEKYNQKAALILVTGEHESDRKGVAKALEGKLFEDGKVVYFLGIGSVLYGVDADIERKPENRLEHMRRLAEVANLMLDAGMILVVAAAELTQDDLEVIKTAVPPDWIETIWAGRHDHDRPGGRSPAARRRGSGSRGPAQGPPAGQGDHLPPMVTRHAPLGRDRALRARPAARRCGTTTATADAGVREKDDRSPVTLADEVAHGILVDGLRRLDPDHAGGVGGGRDRPPSRTGADWRRFWLVDPLDGTKEFIKRRAEFTVNVALIEDGEPVFGVVLAPALDLLYWAAKGAGAWREEKAGRGRADLLGRGAAPARRSRSWRACRTRRRSWRSTSGPFPWRSGSRPAARSSSAGWPRAAPTSIPGSGPPWSGTWRPATASTASRGGTASDRRR